jgi:hypothetical protein
LGGHFAAAGADDWLRRRLTRASWRLVLRLEGHGVVRGSRSGVVQLLIRFVEQTELC